MSIGASAPGGIARALCPLVLDVSGLLVWAAGEPRGVLVGEFGGVLERLGEPVQERRELLSGGERAAR